MGALPSGPNALHVFVALMALATTSWEKDLLCSPSPFFSRLVFVQGVDLSWDNSDVYIQRICLLDQISSARLASSDGKLGWICFMHPAGMYHFADNVDVFAKCLSLVYIGRWWFCSWPWFFYCIFDQFNLRNIFVRLPHSNTLKLLNLFIFLSKTKSS